MQYANSSCGLDQSAGFRLNTAKTRCFVHPSVASLAKGTGLTMSNCVEKFDFAGLRVLLDFEKFDFRGFEGFRGWQQIRHGQSVARPGQSVARPVQSHASTVSGQYKPGQYSPRPVISQASTVPRPVQYPVPVPRYPPPSTQYPVPTTPPEPGTHYPYPPCPRWLHALPCLASRWCSPGFFWLVSHATLVHLGHHSGTPYWTPYRNCLRDTVFCYRGVT